MFRYFVLPILPSVGFYVGLLLYVVLERGNIVCTTNDLSNIGCSLGWSLILIVTFFGLGTYLEARLLKRVNYNKTKLILANIAWFVGLYYFLIYLGPL